jgi:hypothetical protein
MDERLSRNVEVPTSTARAKTDPLPSEEARHLPLYGRVLLSIGLALHILTVFIGPFTFATSSGPGMASPFAAPIRSALRPYLELAFLDHGYFFFAPNPGPSHLLRAKLEFNDGRPPLVITLPDRKQQWPRLLYHRHFMLAEQLQADFVPPELPPDASGDLFREENWRLARAMYETRVASIEQHLRQQYGADRVTLTRVQHVLRDPVQFGALRQEINAPDTYLELPDAAPLLPAGKGAGP